MACRLLCKLVNEVFSKSASKVASAGASSEPTPEGSEAKFRLFSLRQPSRLLILNLNLPLHRESQISLSHTPKSRQTHHHTRKVAGN